MSEESCVVHPWCFAEIFVESSTWSLVCSVSFTKLCVETCRPVNPSEFDRYVLCGNLWLFAGFLFLFIYTAVMRRSQSPHPSNSCKHQKKPYRVKSWCLKNCASYIHDARCCGEAMALWWWYSLFNASCTGLVVSTGVRDPWACNGESRQKVSVSLPCVKQVS